MSEDIKKQEDVLEKLLSVDPEDVPTKDVYLKRLGAPIKIKALSGDKIFKLRRQYTYYKNKRGQQVQHFDEEGFSIGLIVAATVEPKWDDQRLLDKFKVGEPEDVVKRALYAGEIARLGDAVLELSGFDEDEDDLKN